MFKQLKRISNAVKFIKEFSLLTDDKNSTILLHRRSGVLIKFGGDGSFAIQSERDLCLDGQFIKLNSSTSTDGEEEERQAQGNQVTEEGKLPQRFSVAGDSRKTKGGRTLSTNVSCGLR